MLSAMGLLSLPVPALRAQENPSLRDQMKARQHQAASALKAQHKLEVDSAKKQHLSKAQRKQMRKSMKQESRQMRQANKAQWRDLKAQDRWHKQHEKKERAIPSS
jgi:alkylated DNA repair dioxygenase AlkB